MAAKDQPLQFKLDRCHNCKFWERQSKEADEYQNLFLDWGAEGGKVMFPTTDRLWEKFGKCSNLRLIYTSFGYSNGEEKLANADGSELIHWDMEDYQSHLRTGENFGCVHHEKA